MELKKIEGATKTVTGKYTEQENTNTWNYLCSSLQCVFVVVNFHSYCKCLVDLFHGSIFSGYHFTWCTVEVFSGRSHAQGHRWEIDRWSFVRESWDKIDKAGDRTLLQALLSNIGKCLSSRRQLPLCSQIWKTRWKKIFSFWFSFEKPDSKPCLIDWPPLGAGDLLAAMWTTMTGGWRCLGQLHTGWH